MKIKWFKSNHFLILVFATVFLASLGVFSYNAFADSVSGTILVSGAYGVMTNPNTHMTYVANGNGYHIQVINDATNMIVANVTTASVPANDNACHTYNVAVNPVTNMIYTSNDACVYGPPSGVSQWIPQTISVINGTNNNVVTAIQVWGGQFRSQPPQPIAVNTATNKIYALVDDEAYLAVIDGSTNQVITDIAMSNHTTDNEYPTSDIAINPQTNTIYVLDNNIVHVVDGKTDTLVTNFSWGKSSIQGIGVNPTSNQIYVSNSDNSVSVIDGTTYNVISTIQAGTYGIVGVNTATNKIYVSYPSSYPVSHNTSVNTNIVSVIDGATNTLLSQVVVGQSPYGIGIDTTTNNIYVGNIGSSTVSVIDGSSSNTFTVPSTPQNLQAVASNAQVSLSWSAPSSNGGSTITGYNIYRGTVSGSESSTPVGTVSGSALTYTDTELTNGQTYFYKVTAINSVGESSQSNEASATPTMPVTSPQPPTGLTATSTSTSQINLSWAAPTNNGGSAITGYDIERSTDNGFTWSTIQSNTGSTATTYSDTGLAASTTYTYRVSAINSVGTSQPSNVSSATTSTVTPPPPTGIVLNNIQSTSGTVSSSNQMTLANFNVGTGNNRLLVVGISANNNNAISVTFGGISMTQIAGSFYNNDVEFWYLKNPTGTGNVVVTTGGSTQAVVGAYSFAGVNQTTPIPTHVTKHNTTPNSPNITITAKFANDWILDLPSIYGGSTLGSPTCTQQWDDNVPDAITGASSSKMVQTPGAVTCKWTASSGDFWDDAAIEIKASK